VWWLAITPGPGGDVLVPIASQAFTTFFSSHAGYIWLFGSIVVQLVIIFVPQRFFVRKKESAA
jgi:beta-lactamase regulating signal transducer with metallopeptidase domain